MVKLAANLSMMFQDLPFLDRIDAAAKAGFAAIEYMFSYDVPAEQVRARLDANGLRHVLLNSPAGDWAGGDRGLAAVPGRDGEFRGGVQRALDYAGTTGCTMIHAMAGMPPAGAETAAHHTYLDNLMFAADAAAACDMTVIIEPINTRVDIPGYFLNGTAQALAVLEACGRPNLRLQYDIYHMQIMEGDLARSIARLLPQIAHIQLADNPGRNEPGTGEIRFDWLLSEIDRLGYAGWIGCEYRPLGDTVAGLGWAKPYLSRD
ncbi:2-oxo-tetronate isomerase [Novosphingobium sp. BL-52-GroH]|uniref:2-oxo-tetronate isomerase n=1 Tax=Novosphingobium sp. BL-52-GroH TaxID=3349877 RepID=UPI00384E4B82